MTPRKSGHTLGVTDEAAIELALEQARLAASVGEVPVGAVVIVGDEVVAARHNERETTNDPTAHAEVLALRDAAAASGDWRLEDATLAVTLEPCPMCAGAALSARVARVVFGAYDPKAGAAATLYNLLVDPRFNHNSEVIGGVLEDECGELLSRFFSNHR
ncbi:tRNA adenosine(34) deaminase TadA [Candidatus Poriferisodalis sp.]|uniref:tRNA adenosine(34) deaminase TadA n=1 Tax=Candidatus Poriferisodalis sp. TaxID=3101277 RepID=UPI003B530207